MALSKNDPSSIELIKSLFNLPLRVGWFTTVPPKNLDHDSLFPTFKGTIQTEGFTVPCITPDFIIVLSGWKSNFRGVDLSLPFSLVIKQKLLSKKNKWPKVI